MNGDDVTYKPFMLLLGFRGEHRYTYLTESNVLCVKLITDGTISFKGFNATYTKYYNGTNIKGWLNFQ